MTDLKKLWDIGIGEWCESVQGVFSRSTIQPWIKNCDLPGDHQLIFWNNGNEEESPKEIGVRFYPKEGGHISIGDLEKIEGDCIDAKSDSQHNSFFSKSEIRGRFCRAGDNWSLFVGVHNERKDFKIFEPLTPDELRDVQQLEKEYVVADEQYKKIDAEYKVQFEKALTEHGLWESEAFKKLRKEHDHAGAVCSQIGDKIFKIRKNHTQFYSSGIEEEKLEELLDRTPDIQIKSMGAMSGYIFDFTIAFPSGPPPRKNKEPQDETMTLVPAPYSAIRNIDESAWDNEFKLKSDAIDFYIDGTNTATTLTELYKMGIKTVRIIYPSGRKPKILDLDDLLKEEK
jgi:hypothetical protein